MQVLLKFNKEQERLLKSVGLRDGKSVKRYLLEKVKDDTKQSVLVALLKELSERLVELSKEQRELFLFITNKLEEFEEAVRGIEEAVREGETVDGDSKREGDTALWFIKEILKIFIWNYATLFQEQTKNRVLKEIDELYEKVRGSND